MIPLLAVLCSDDIKKNTNVVKLLFEKVYIVCSLVHALTRCVRIPMHSHASTPATIHPGAMTLSHLLEEAWQPQEQKQRHIYKREQALTLLQALYSGAEARLSTPTLTLAHTSSCCYVCV